MWSPTTFCKNRDRLLEGDVAEEIFVAVLSQAEEKKLLSQDHFSVDGTLIEAWASHQSFRPKDEETKPADGGSDFRGQKRSNEGCVPHLVEI